MKINNKKIITVLMIVFVCFTIFTSMGNVFGVTGGDGETNLTENEDIKTALSFLAFATAGPLTMAISLLIMTILLAVFMLLWAVFTPITGGLYFPFPDKIIFNQIPFFDPNFINPTTSESAPVNILQDMISGFYYTGFVIAGAVFLVSAMVIGVKLAISTIASEKAHYKKSLTTWLVALVLLFTTHFIMAGIFTINEEMVKLIEGYSRTIKFEQSKMELIPYIGDDINSAISGTLSVIDKALTALGKPFDLESNLEEEYTEEDTMKFEGYGGLILMFALKGATGDISSAIIFGIVLGQTCALIVMYIKRLFYSIVLGITAPLVIAADVIKKSM